MSIIVTFGIKVREFNDFQSGKDVEVYPVEDGQYINVTASVEEIEIRLTDDGKYWKVKKQAS